MPAPLRHRLHVIARKLESAYGKPEPWREASELDALIKTILSQNTTDKTSFPAFAALKQKYPRWEQVFALTPKQLAKIIRPAGLANTKAKVILGVLKELKRRTGTLSLAFLHKKTTPQAREFLLSLRGVGPKTAAVVLNFAFHRPTFPVDTHVYRVSRRLGLVPQKFSREQTQEFLDRVVPDNQKTSLHVNLIQHGRAVCRAPTPHCPRCVLFKLCPRRGVKKYY